MTEKTKFEFNGRGLDDWRAAQGCCSPELICPNCDAKHTHNIESYFVDGKYLAEIKCPSCSFNGKTLVWENENEFILYYNKTQEETKPSEELKPEVDEHSLITGKAKPCPFCGSDKYLKFTEIKDEYYKIECYACGYFRGDVDLEMCLSMWDYRPRETALETQLACLDKENDEIRRDNENLQRQLMNKDVHLKTKISEVETQLAKKEKELNEIRPEVLKFAKAMEKKLKENDHKGGWKDCDISYLNHSLNEEVSELQSAILEEGYITDECVDIANFAMMIFDILKENES